MFDIIIKDGKKESYIKLNGTKLEGFSALNGVVTPLTIEEVNTINLLKLSDDKSYLGNDNGYDIYIDNISGLKHYFKDGKEDVEATWLNNGEDALIYKGDKLNNDKDDVKKITLDKGKIAFISYIAYMVISITNTVFKIPEYYENKTAKSSQEQEAVNYTFDYFDNATITVTTNELYDSVTLEQIESYIAENANLTEEDRKIYGNKKLLQDVIPYYENTNMNVLIPLKFNNLQTMYYYAEPDEDGNLTLAYYDITKPNRIFVNTYCDKKEFYDKKAHEYIHLLQSTCIYRYIMQASAELISYEYYDKCQIDAYQKAVKNIKILMEIVGPEPIWKVNFSDDTDLVNIIRSNLEEEQADKLISLLKEEPDLSQTLDEDIYSLLSQMYINMYGEDIKTNSFINSLLDGIPINNRYYFNSEKIEKEAPYIEKTIATLPPNYTFQYAYVVSNNYNSIIQDDIFREDSEDLFMLSKNNIEIHTLKDLTKEMIAENEITFYYHGKEISLEDINLPKYENVSVVWKSGINPEKQVEVVKEYYPTIYESFPEQRIGGNELKNNSY